MVLFHNESLNIFSPKLPTEHTFQAPGFQGLICKKNMFEIWNMKWNVLKSTIYEHKYLGSRRCQNLEMSWESLIYTWHWQTGFRKAEARLERIDITFSSWYGRCCKEPLKASVCASYQNKTTSLLGLTRFLLRPPELSENIFFCGFSQYFLVI